MSLDRGPASGTVVALRALGLGDLLTALPALRGLRAHVRARFPGGRLLLTAPAWLEPVATLSGAVDGLVPTAPLAPVAVTAPELAVNLHGRGPESTATLRRTRPRALWAFDLPGGCPWERPAAGARSAGDDGVEHEVDRWCRLLAAHGVACDRRDLDLPVPRPAPAGPPAARAGATIVHPGGAAPARRWPPARWSAVARALSAGGHRVVVTGSAAERGLAAGVAADAGLPPEATLAGELDLLGLCALVAHARLLVSADTGAAHLATAYRTQSVVLFGPVPPAEWGPPPDRPIHQCLWSGRRGEPRASSTDPGLLDLSVDAVLRAAARTPPPARRRRHDDAPLSSFEIAFGPS